MIRVFWGYSKRTALGEYAKVSTTVQGSVLKFSFHFQSFLKLSSFLMNLLGCNDLIFLSFPKLFPNFSKLIPSTKSYIVYLPVNLCVFSGSIAVWDSEMRTPLSLQRPLFFSLSIFNYSRSSTISQLSPSLHKLLCFWVYVLTFI